VDDTLLQQVKTPLNRGSTQDGISNRSSEGPGLTNRPCNIDDKNSAQGAKKL